MNTNNTLIDAVRAGNLPEVKAALAAGADVHANRDEVLCWAVHNGHPEVVKELLAAGADVHIRDGAALLRYAAHNGFLEVVKALLDAGTDAHAIDNYIFKNCSTEVVDFIKQYQSQLKESSLSKSVSNSVAPKNNDNRAICFSCGGKTKQVPGLSSIYTVCCDCGK